MVDQAAEDFAEVFAEEHGRAVRLAYLLVGDRHRADDIAAEAMLNVFRRWRRGRIDEVGPYLRRAVVNEARSRWRRGARERAGRARRTADGRGVHGHAERLADRDAVVAALQRLPTRTRTAIVLRYYADLSERETAQVMGVAVGTVKSTVSRGLDRLRELMVEEAA